MLRIEHLTKLYGEKKAVDDLSLHIRAGEIYGFIGHNGAGKTTTIKSCCGILQFEQGEIYVDGISIKADPIAVNARLPICLIIRICMNSSAVCSTSILLPMYSAFLRKRENRELGNMPISLDLRRILHSRFPPILTA